MTNKRILIIDDDAEFCEELAESLEYEGYLVTYSTDALQAEKLIKEGCQQVVLLDDKMPEISGLDILKKLGPDNLNKRIFVVSGRHSLEQQIEEAGLSHMIAGAITKPIDFEKLLEKINQVFNRMAEE